MIKSRRMRWEGRVARMVVREDAYKILGGKSPLRRPRCRREDKIRKLLREMGWCGMD
jgi:hypothetical protein